MKRAKWHITCLRWLSASDAISQSSESWTYRKHSWNFVKSKLPSKTAIKWLDSASLSSKGWVLWPNWWKLRIKNVDRSTLCQISELIEQQCTVTPVCYRPIGSAYRAEGFSNLTRPNRRVQLYRKLRANFEMDPLFLECFVTRMKRSSLLDGWQSMYLRLVISRGRRNYL